VIESRNDLVLRILDEIAFLTARMAGLQALGLSEEILREVERLEQASGQLDSDGRANLDQPLAELRTRVRTLLDHPVVSDPERP